MTDRTSTDNPNKNQSSCAVFKTNLEGRFVAIDLPTGNLLGLAEDDLFGRSVRDFLDKESFKIVQAILNQTRRYETFFEAADLIFIDNNQKQHVHSVVISLNFIGGNPANFQFMVNTSCERQIEKSEENDPSDVNSKLFDYVSSLNGSIKWDGLGHILLDISPVYAVGVHRYNEGKLRPIYSAVKENSPEDIQLSAISDDHKMSADRLETVSLKLDNKNDDIIETVVPLIQGGRCWGILRVIHTGELADIKPDIKTLGAFLGNALFSFVTEKSDLKRVSV